MYVLCNAVVDKNPWVVLVNIQGTKKELYDIADTCDFTIDLFLVRTIYHILLAQIGLRGALYIVDIEWEDDELLEFLIATNRYPFYEGEVGDF